jgi:CHAD domain-containing protein
VRGLELVVISTPNFPILSPQLLLISLDMDKITLADYIYPAIQKQYVAILSHEANVINDGDVEAIHQMRVSLRRMRSVIQAFVPILDIPKVMGAKQIAKVAKILGKVRDLDVLSSTCKTYQVDLPESEQVYLDEIRSTIIKRRRKAIIKVQSMFEAEDYQYLKLSINNWLNNPQYMPIVQVPIVEVLPYLILPVVGKLFLNSGWWLKIDLASVEDPELAFSEFLVNGGQTLHDLRKQVKATRYLMELFPDRYSLRYNEYLHDLKEIHQLLGAIQDSIVFGDFIQRVLGKRANIKLPTIYKQIAHHNYLIWQKWQPICAKYQQSVTKQAFQLLLIQELVQS